MKLPMQGILTGEKNTEMFEVINGASRTDVFVENIIRNL